MYKPYFQQGGMAPQQAQQVPDEQQIVQAIVQAFQQLSPQAQQAVVQAISGGGQVPQEEQMMEGQYVPPQQRMGGMYKKKC